MFKLIHSAWLSGIRANSVRWLLIMAVVVLFAAWLAANFSARQPATVALDVGLSGMRLVLMLMGLFWVQELLGKDIERKSLYFVLAYPISREKYLLSRFAAIGGLLALGVAILGAALALVMLVLPTDYQQARTVSMGWQFALVLLGVWLDLLVIAAFGLWLCSISTTPFLPLIAGSLFALAGRSLGVTLDFLLNSEFADPEHVRWLLPLINGGRWLLPDLSRLDWRDISLYSLTPDAGALGLSVLMAAAYCTALLALGGRQLARRELL